MYVCLFVKRTYSFPSASLRRTDLSCTTKIPEESSISVIFSFADTQQGHKIPYRYARSYLNWGKRRILLLFVQGSKCHIVMINIQNGGQITVLKQSPVLFQICMIPKCEGLFKLYKGKQRL